MKRCSQCGESKSVEAFRKDSKRRDGLQSQCKTCRSRLERETYLKHGHKYREQRAARKARAKEFMDTLKTTLQCIRCGEGHISCIVFHHRDPKQKEYGIADMIAGGLPKEKILEELEKCDVLCSNCHRKLYYDLKRDV